jgi:serine/threonine protein kinase
MRLKLNATSNINAQMNDVANLMDVVLEGKYRLDSVIGKGSFGVVFAARNTITSEPVAIKIEDSDSKVLKNEAKMMKLLEEDNGFPRLRSYGKYQEVNYLVMDRLGESLEELRTRCGGKLSLKSVLMFGLVALTRLESLHARGIVHRDIKPDNFLIGGRSEGDAKIHLIDFGLSRRYIDSRERHIDEEGGRKLTGTVRYASVHIHAGTTPSRRDDLESLGYVMIYLLNGGLPWQSITAEDKEARNSAVGIAKIAQPIHDLFPRVPMEFWIWTLYCRTLAFDEDPDYKYLRGLMSNLFRHHGFSMDSLYDWCEE